MTLFSSRTSITRDRTRRKAANRWVSVLTATLLLVGSTSYEAIAQPKPDDKEAFSQHVLQIANQEFPGLNLKKTDRPLQCTWISGSHLSLENLYKAVRQDTEPGQEDEEIRRFLKSMTELKSSASPQKPLAWDEVKSKLRPQIVPAPKIGSAPSNSSDANQKPAKKVIVHRPLPFSTKLFESFVIDSENTFQYVYQENLQKWGVTLDVVSKYAYDNLSKNSQNVKFELNDDTAKDAKTKYITLSVPDGYAAARILLPEIRKRLQKDLGDRCFIGIPNRDFLIAWSPDAPHQERFADQVRRRFQSRHHPLTPQVYQLDDNTLSNAVIIASEESDTPRPRRRKRPRILRRKPDPTTTSPSATPSSTPTQTAPSAPEPASAPIPGFEPSSSPAE